MIWDIVSFGDVKTLNMVFNAIASIFADGGYTAAVMAVALFVIVGSSLISLMSAKPELPYGRLLAGIVIYAMGFSTLTSVSIENRYDGTVTQVDNIPVAIAVPASLISSIGLYLVQTSETAFGGPNDLANISSSGYLSPLKVVASYREAAMLNCPAGEATSTSANINLCQSLRAYYSECAMVKATRDNEYLKMRETNRLDAIKFDSRAHTTLIVDGTGQQTTVTCAEAYDRIKTAFDGETFENIITANNVAAGVRAGEDGLIRTADALEAIQIDSSRSRDFLASLYLNKAADSGELAFYHRMGSSDLAENLNSSIQQRDYAWTLQGEMWVQIVDKFLSIMECIIYALAPFIGLMVLVGTVGSKVMMVYLQLIAVIQLIPVMLVVTQSIVINDLTNYATMMSAQYDIGSREFVYAMTDKAKELMGLGGMISATIVPAMAMALVTGSSMAMFGAMKQAAATAKDSDAMPDVASQGGAMVDMGWRNAGRFDQFGNASSEAGRTEIGSIMSGHALKNSVREAEAHKSATEQAYATSVGELQTNQAGQSWSTEQLTAMGKSVSSSIGENQTWATTMQTQLSQQYGLTSTEASNVVGALSLGASLSKAGGQVSTSFTDGLTKNEAEIYNQVMGGQATDSIQSSYQNALNYIDQNSDKVSTNNAYMNSKIAKAENAYNEKTSAEQSYESAKSLESSFSMQGGDVMTKLYAKANEDGIHQRMNSTINELRTDDPNAYNYFREKEAEYGGERGMDPATARLAALASTAHYQDDIGSFATNVWSSGGGTPTNNIDTSVTNGSFERPVNDVRTTPSDYDEGAVYRQSERHNEEVNNRELGEKDKLNLEEKRNEIRDTNPMAGNLARAIYEGGVAINDGILGTVNTLESTLHDKDSGGTVLKIHEKIANFMDENKIVQPGFYDEVMYELKGMVNEAGFNLDNPVPTHLLSKEEREEQLNDKSPYDMNEIPK